VSNDENKAPYPDIINNLPEAAVGFEGVRGWLSQGEDHQIVFFDIEPIGEISEHSHGAQWGIVIDGEMDLTIGGVTRTCRKGDSYFIPEGVLHSAVFKKRTLALDFFADRDRYKPMEGKGST
jgi:quercetin dioxygenase-like cupin family protein